MSEEPVINSDTKVENIDSDKSFESCVNEVVDSVCKLEMKDDDSEKSYLSCDDDKIESNDTPKIELAFNNNTVEEEDDDDIRPGSCREEPSSEDEVSSWDENNDPWIYDEEYLEEAIKNLECPEKPECVSDAIDNQEAPPQKAIPERKHKKEREFRKKQNPTYIPTSGRFFMHDIRSSESSRPPPRKSRQPKVKVKPQDNWRHDLYDEAAQKPLSRNELASKYGTDGATRQRRHQKQSQPRRGGRVQNSQYYDYDDYQQYWYRYPYGYYDDCERSYYENTDYYYEPGYYDADPCVRTRSQHQQIPQRDPRKQRNPSNRAPINQNGHPQQQHGHQRENRQKKPPSKYSQISELTEIRITVDRDKLGKRQIHSATSAGVAKTTAETPSNNSGDVHSSSGNPTERTEASVLHDELKQTRNNRRYNNNNGNNNGASPYRPGPTGPPRTRAPPTAPPAPPAKSANATTTSSNTHRGNQNRSRQLPEWVDTKYEWGDGGDFCEMPKAQQQADPEKETPNRDRQGGVPRGATAGSSSVTSSGPLPQPPRFSKGAHAPRRYSEMRTADSALVPPDSALLGYRHQGGMEQLYGGLAPVLLNLGPSQGPSSPSIIKQQQQQHTQLVSLIQPSCYGSNPQQHHAGPPADIYGSPHGVGGVNSSGQYFLQQFYLPPGPVPGPLPSQPSSASRLNRFSPPFQPAYLSGANVGGTPTASLLSGGSGSHVSVAPGTGTTSANVVARPVLGRS